MRKLLDFIENIFNKIRKFTTEMIKVGLLELRNLFVYIIIALFVYVFFMNIGSLSNSMSEMSEVGKPEDWLSFFGAVLGSIVAIIGAYVLTIINTISEKKEKNKLAELIIKNYLRHEIEHNFKSCSIEYVKNEFSTKSINGFFQYGFNENYLKFEEFDKIKYELLKYDSDIIKHTLEVYEMFYTLSKLGDYKNLGVDKIKYYINLYVLYRKKYICAI